MDLLPSALAVGSGSLVGLVLGVIGGGGSILAVPLLLYVVGMRDPHMAIGTGAVAVAANAAANLLPHARAGNVKWPCALVFAVTGMAGAALGAQLGLRVEGQRLLALFAIAMIAVGINMLRRAAHEGDPGVRITPVIGMRLAMLGFAAGILAGFFGIGGGFLIVPGLIAGSGMAMLNAVASSLIGVSAFGATTAASYAWSGLVDWPVAALFLAGGVAGGWLGAALAQRLAARRALLGRIFAIVLFAVAAFMLWRSAKALGWF